MYLQLQQALLKVLSSTLLQGKLTDQRAYLYEPRIRV
jgi:hypothetical protein